MKPPAEHVRVLIVDDSALIRRLLSELLGSSPRIEVVGTARDGTEAIAMVEQLRPDVVTLDVEMPGMSGLDTLPALLDVRPVPVVMISAWTQEGAEVTLSALELGAVDFLPKPDKHQHAELRAARDVLVGKVLMASKSRVRRSPPTRASVPEAEATRADREVPTITPSRPATRCVVLGISTGGPQTLTRAFAEVTRPVPPIVIVQHMPAQFTGVFAHRLDRRCRVAVVEATESHRIEPDQIVIAPGGRHLMLAGRPPHVRTCLSDAPPVHGHRPSIDILFQSAATVYGPDAIGVLMTGMGRDGVEGCRQILEAGGATFGQDEASSIIYGMNKVAFERGYIQRQISADDLAELLQDLV